MPYPGGKGGVGESMSSIHPLLVTTFIRQDDNFMFPRDSTCEMPQVCSIDCASDEYQNGTHVKF